MISLPTNTTSIQAIYLPFNIACGNINTSLKSCLTLRRHCNCGTWSLISKCKNYVVAITQQNTPFRKPRLLYFLCRPLKLSANSLDDLKNNPQTAKRIKILRMQSVKSTNCKVNVGD